MNHRFRALAAAAAASLALLTSCGEDAAPEATTAEEQPAAEASITVEDGWVRATKGTEDPTMTAAFMDINNSSDAEIVLVGGSTSVAGMTQLHEMVMDDKGAMMMQEMDGGLVIEADGHAHLEPGGNHVMLMDLQQELAPGDEVSLTLEFDDGSTQELLLPVKAFTEEEPHYHESEGADMEMEESPSP
jgi:periplasmic copper chaperone A